MCENCKYALRYQISDIVCDNKKSIYYQQYTDDIKECSKFEEIKRGPKMFWIINFVIGLYNIFNNIIIH